MPVQQLFTTLFNKKFNYGKVKLSNNVFIRLFALFVLKNGVFLLTQRRPYL